MQAASAQEKFPSRTSAFVVPYGPGGATDIVARIVGEAMQKLSGQTSWSRTSRAHSAFSRSRKWCRRAPDGYTLKVGNVSTNAITPVIAPEKLRSTTTDVVPVTNLIDVPAFLAVTTRTNFR